MSEYDRVDALEKELAKLVNPETANKIRELINAMIDCERKWQEFVVAEE